MKILGIAATALVVFIMTSEPTWLDTNYDVKVGTVVMFEDRLDHGGLELGCKQPDFGTAEVVKVDGVHVVLRNTRGFFWNPIRKEDEECNLFQRTRHWVKANLGDSSVVRLVQEHEDER